MGTPPHQFQLAPSEEGSFGDRQDDLLLGSPLVEAVLGHHEELALYLLSCLRGDEALHIRPGAVGKSVLHVACQGGLLQVVKDIVLKHSRYTDVVLPQGVGTLHCAVCYAALHGHVDVLLFLLDYLESKRLKDKVVAESCSCGPLFFHLLYGDQPMVRLGHFDIYRAYALTQPARESADTVYIDTRDGHIIQPR
jgi:hypothetical protein